ncbi:MAG TPA: hypothetical protein VGM90_05170 [Kofleriaceae bacterium]|jgi:hypothetical protein
MKAHVRNGRLVLDEPTDLPDGSVVPLEVSSDWDDLDDADRAALHAEIATSINERQAGVVTRSADEVLAELGGNGARTRLG